MLEEQINSYWLISLEEPTDEMLAYIMRRGCARNMQKSNERNY